MLEKIQAMLAEALNLPLEKVTPDAKIVEDLGADSLDTVEIVMEFEKEFGLDVDSDAAEKFQTVGDVISYLEANVKKAE